MTNTAMLTEEQIKQYDRDGYLVIENFISEEKCRDLLNECNNIIEQKLNEDPNIPIVSYNGDAEILAAASYFMNANDKIRLFLEGERQESKRDNVEKIGYAIHALNPIFKELTFSKEANGILKQLGFEKPVTCQSQLIFKRAFTGGEVSVHQDATSLHVNPDERKLIGFWIALEDATVNNGCIDFIPGSHKGSLARKLMRNPNLDELKAGKLLTYSAPLPEYDLNSFVAAPVKAGSLVLIDGLVVHKSKTNLSDKSRNIYTWHIYESSGDDESSWAKTNWLKYSPISFLRCYDQ